MPNKTMHVEGIGSITLKQNKRARNITLRIVPGPEIIISAPRVLSEKKARQIILEKKSWIQKKLKSERFKKNRFEIGDVIATLHYRILLTDTKPIPSEDDNFFFLIIREDITLDETQEQIRISLREILREEAKAYLPQRVAWLAQQHHFTYNKITIKDSKTRWGSCSSKKNINLSLYLMRLPAHLIDYIILHELSHTVHLNHGNEFHALMDRLTGSNESKLRKELRNYNTGI